MNIKAKQLLSIDLTRMDITTVLGFLFQIREQIRTNEALRTALSTVWTAFTQAYAAFDEAYAQQRKWAQTEELEELDKQRDKALSAFLQAIKAMISSPNAEKAQRAKYLQNIRDKYTLDPSAEYMKETTAIQQMVQEMDRNYQCELALNATGINDFYADLKTKNEAFLAKMNERTEAQSYQQKGIVRETRIQAEQAYKDLVKLINALAIVEVPDTIDYYGIVSNLNAEIDHYKQILARKGTTADGSSDDDDPQPEPTPDPEPQPEPEPTPVTPE